MKLIGKNQLKPDQHYIDSLTIPMDLVSGRDRRNDSCSCSGNHFRTCEFCGCNTNANMRRCCNKGTHADLTKSSKMFGCSIRENEFPCESCNAKGKIIGSFADDSQPSYVRDCKECDGKGRISKAQFQRQLGIKCEKCKQI
jgi:hypothetical protein